MPTKTIQLGDFLCEISPADDGFSARLKHGAFEVGQFTGPTPDAIRAQFEAVFELVENNNGIVRHNTLMLGYFGEKSGDVFSLEGEYLGNWAYGEHDICSFVSAETGEIECNATSPWLLHDSIAYWMHGEDA